MFWCSLSLDPIALECISIQLIVYCFGNELNVAVVRKLRGLMSLLWFEEVNLLFERLRVLLVYRLCCCLQHKLRGMFCVHLMQSDFKSES